MRMIRYMAEQDAPPSAAASSEESTPPEAEQRSASDDLAAGLDLMLRAARKALKNIEPTRIEELGRRAMKGIEHLDRKKVSEIGKKAAKSLDPRKIEEVAEEAGRELLSVVERVAERIEDMLAKSGKPTAQPTPAKSADGNAQSEAVGERPRVRVDGDTT